MKIGQPEMIALWKGVPVSEMPRDELEREFVAAHREIGRLHDEIARQSVEHISDLAQAAIKEHARETNPIFRSLKYRRR